MPRQYINSPDDLDACFLEPLDANPSSKPPPPELSTGQLTFLMMARNAIPGYVLVLTGEGGSGKTTVLAELAKETSVLFLAPTHQARTVLFEALVAAGVEDPKVSTVAKFLDKRPDYNYLPENVLETRFVGGDGAAQDEGDVPNVVAVDEASMVSERDLRAIRSLTRDGLLVITIDAAQLPPVRDLSPWPLIQSSIAAGRAGLVTLTDNHRSQFPALTQFLNYVRTHADLPEELPAEVVTRFTSRQQIIEATVAAAKAYGPENVVLLAYTNAMVDSCARAIRAGLGYPRDLPAEGEILRFDAPVPTCTWHEAYRRLLNRGLDREEAFNGARAEVAATQIQNGTLGRVVEVGRPIPFFVSWAPTQAEVLPLRIEILTGALSGEVFSVLAPPMGDWDNTASPHMKLLAECRDVAKRIRAIRADGPATIFEGAALQELVGSSGEPNMSAANPKLFYAVRDRLAQVSSALAMTTHKAQGSGRDHVMVVWSDLRGPDERQLRYTAVSRARRHLYLLA